MSAAGVHRPAISPGRSISASSAGDAPTSAAFASSALPPRSPVPACNRSNSDRANSAGGMAVCPSLDATTGASAESKRARNACRWAVVTKGMSASMTSAAAAGPRAASAMPSASERDNPAASSVLTTISKPSGARWRASRPSADGQTAIRRPGARSAIRAAAWRTIGIPDSGASNLSASPKRREPPAASSIAQTSRASIIVPASPVSAAMSHLLP